MSWATLASMPSPLTASVEALARAAKIERGVKLGPLPGSAPPFVGASRPSNSCAQSEDTEVGSSSQARYFASRYAAFSPASMLGESIVLVLSPDATLRLRALMLTV